jgi:hypothetical protein
LGILPRNGVDNTVFHVLSDTPGQGHANEASEGSDMELGLIYSYLDELGSAAADAPVQVIERIGGWPRMSAPGSTIGEAIYGGSGPMWSLGLSIATSMNLAAQQQAKIAAH